ncbi:SCO family protein [Calidifontibacillus erzurumensis]|uniref:SCO family protein n=1 Tax=Calidifontibacillus erzurumensis TaxID=2741433 RepID=A0A8J8GBU0_9BACI|nr:SCO family protein [Calidifontibacillus erzurumensis]NSL50929.1 SCO family protein [Calidifontibacillus erzurumensis]
MRNHISTVIIFIVGLFILWEGTDGLRAFTAEKARQINIMEKKPLLPNVSLEDGNGKALQLYDYKGKIVLATFMYTSCGDVCPILEMKFKEVYDQLPKELIGKEVVFLSFSFDPFHDTPERLKVYENHFGADGITWKMVRFSNEKQQQQFLDLAGVIVIPKEDGGFEHNAAIYLINEQVRLIEIFDYQHSQNVVNKVRAMIEKRNRS